MADNLNPFDDTNISDIIEYSEYGSDFTAHISPPTIQIRSENTDISWDSIASKLLRDNYILTALELYTEFIESGRDLPRLRDYFSNPGNFERTKEDTPSPTLRKHYQVMSFVVNYIISRLKKYYNSISLTSLAEQIKLVFASQTCHILSHIKNDPTYLIFTF